MSNFSSAVQVLLGPSVDFRNLDNTLAGLTIQNQGVTPPTQAQVDAEIVRQTALRPEEKEMANHRMFRTLVRMMATEFNWNAATTRAKVRAAWDAEA